MMADYDTALATPDDIPGILALQEPNLPYSGGNLSVRQNADWFRRSMAEMPLIVGRRDGKLVCYMGTTTLAAKAHVAIVQAMFRVFPPPPNCYSYGRFCGTESERGKGLPAALLEKLRAELPCGPA